MLRITKATPNKFSVSRPPPASSYRQLYYIPLFRILLLFSSYCCILTGSSETMSAHVSAVLSSLYEPVQTSRLCYFCSFKRKEQA